MISLTVLRGSHKGEVLELPEGGSYRIGRRPSTSRPLPSPLKFEDRKMSRRHAEVCWIDGAWYLVDLHSTNGTFVNRKRMEGRMKLREGDLLQMGETLFAVGDPSPHLKPESEGPVEVEAEVEAKPARPVARPDKPGKGAPVGMSEDDAADVISAMIAGEDEEQAKPLPSLKDSLDLDGSEVASGGPGGSRTGASETSAGMPALLDDDDDDDGMVGRPPAKPAARRREAEPGKLDVIDEIDSLLVQETEGAKPAAEAKPRAAAPKPAPTAPALAKAKADAKAEATSDAKTEELDLSLEAVEPAKAPAAPAQDESDDLSDLDLSAMGSPENEAENEKLPSAEIMLEEGDAEAAEAKPPSASLPLEIETEPEAQPEPSTPSPAAAPPAAAAAASLEKDLDDLVDLSADAHPGPSSGKVSSTKAEEEVGLSMWAAPVDDNDPLDVSVTGPTEELAVGKPRVADEDEDAPADSVEVVDLGNEPASDEPAANDAPREGLTDIDLGEEPDAKHAEGEAAAAGAGLSEAESLADEIANSVISEDRSKAKAGTAKKGKKGTSKWLVLGGVGVVLAAVAGGAVYAFKTLYPRPSVVEQTRNNIAKPPAPKPANELPPAPKPVEPVQAKNPVELPPPTEVERNGTIDGAPIAPPSEIPTHETSTPPAETPAPSASTPDASAPEKAMEKPAAEPASTPPAAGVEPAKPADPAPVTQPASRSAPAATPAPAPAQARKPAPLPTLAGTAFLIDASGAQIDAFPLLIDHLDTLLSHLEEKERFTVIAFQAGGAVELGATGLRAASPAARRQVIETLRAEPAVISPRGSADAEKAIRLAIRYHVRDVHLLSDRPTVGATPGPEPIMSLLTQLDPSQRTRVHGVQFFYKDSRETLRTITSNWRGTYRFIQDKQAPLPAGGGLDAVLIGGPGQPTRSGG